MQTCEPELQTKQFKEFQKLIYGLAGINLADSKVVMVQGRLAKRLRALHLDSYDEYLRFLKSGDSQDEQTQFINCLTTNKTDFFRESHHFDFLKKVVFPRIEQRAATTGDRTVRIWSSASSTGEEPYSIAMCAAEKFSRHAGWEVKILATDIDTNVLATAAQAIYEQDRIERYRRTIAVVISKNCQQISTKSSMNCATWCDLIKSISLPINGRFGLSST